MVLLKTFQRLGYFVRLSEIPEPVIGHVARLLGFRKTPDLSDYDHSGSRQRHVQLIREFLSVQVFNDDARRKLLDAVREAAITKQDLSDIVNVGIEELVRLRFELPGFSTILRTAQYARTQVNQHLYAQVSGDLGPERKQVIDALFDVANHGARSEWEMLKKDPGRPTLNTVRKLVAQVEWLKARCFSLPALKSIPDNKVRHFAAEARSLDAARMQALAADKRYTLACSLLMLQRARRLDDLGDVLVKQIQKIHHKGKEALLEYRIKHQAETDALVGKLRNILVAMRDTEAEDTRWMAVEEAAGDDRDETIERCDAHAAFANDNYAPFLWRFYKSYRKVLFSLLRNMELKSTSADRSIEQAIEFIKDHRTSKSNRVNAEALDLTWVSEKWWRVLRADVKADEEGLTVDRRHFEICVFSQIVHELKSGDLCIPGSDNYSDYSEQLISWSEFENLFGSYCEQAGIDARSADFVEGLRHELENVASAVDRAFPENESLRIENGEPILKKSTRKTKSPHIAKLEQFIEERLEKISILDVLVDSQSWLNWTAGFGPISGHDRKIDNPISRYVATVFCYGCGLGPAQTARSLKIADRRQLAWVNQRHITEESLDKLITEIVNKYNRFALPKVWGSGKSASADGTKWDLYEQNLLSEYHIRYGGYGGLGYYHVSDTYIALFSHFIPCGVWEAVYILDGLLKNESEIQPDTLHGDTQAQSTPVFGLAHLLGINLMPRIRNWKKLKFFRPSKDAVYNNIDELFTDTVNWNLISDHFYDLLRIVISIKTGRISASSILKRLGSFSRKNKLYDAFQELGSVIRTIFLLKYISDPELRKTIHAATNKSESFNDFIKWIRFGGDGTIQENDRDEQRKLIKYNHFVANCVIFHNVWTLTRLLNDLAIEGHEFDERTIAEISPYIRDHINRFGDYFLNFERKQPSPVYETPLKQKKYSKAS